MNYQPVFQSYQVSDPVRPGDALFTTSSSHLSLWCNFSRLKLQIQPWLRLLEVLNVIYFGWTGFISRIEVFKNYDNCHRRCCISNWQLWHYTLERFVAHCDILHLIMICFNIRKLLQQYGLRISSFEVLLNLNNAFDVFSMNGLWRTTLSIC